MGRVSIRLPITDSSAGTNVSATTTDAAITTIPPIPMDRSIESSKIRRPVRPKPVVIPENRIALPAVATVTATLSSTSLSDSSSRYLLTINSE